MAGKKKLKVINSQQLIPGAEFELSNFQVSASNNDGIITMANCEVTEENVGYENIGYEIKPGVFRITPKDGMNPIEFLPETFFETETSEMLRKHFNVFVNKLDLYKKYNIPPKRSILFHSEPGVGKSALIRNFCRGLSQRNDVCVLIIDSEGVNYEVVTQMFMRESSEKKSGVNLIVLVIEDIGGSSLNERHQHVDSTLLNFLDGNGAVFGTPTLIVSTTNFIDCLGDTMTKRPGRIDVVLDVAPPSDEEVLAIVSNFLNRELTDTEKKVLKGTKLTPAYSRECIIRSDLYEISLEESVSQIVKQREIASKKFDKSRAMGFGDSDYDD